MKRLFDVIGSIVGLILFSPIMVVLYFLILRNMGNPAFFRQARPGKDGKPFELIKFRSMKDAVDKDGNQLSDAERISSLGAKLRSSSADELPEFWSVLKGEMSLVGPRPLLMEYLPLYSTEQARRHDVRPGITGWAQINGRNALTWEEKFALDIWYVDNQSLWLDIKIIFMTIKKVLMRDGIAAEGEATMPKFQGSP